MAKSKKEEAKKKKHERKKEKRKIREAKKEIINKKCISEGLKLANKKRSHKERLKYYIFSRYNIFTWLIKVIISLFNRGDIMRALGSHIITGYPGSGKTLVMNKIINETDNEKYFFLSNIKEFDNVDTFSLEDLFYEGKQQKSIPIKDSKGRSLYGLIFDEINLNFNRRMNRTTDYNKLFVGLIEFLVSHRHQGIPRVYFIGQKLELQDTQLQSLFKYQHDIIRTRRFPFYWIYKTTLDINFAPRKLIIVNRVKSIDDDFLELGLSKIKINKRNMQTYNTHALADDYKNLPSLEIKKADK